MLTEDSLNGNEKLPQCRISRISLLFCETGTLTYFFLPLAAPLFHKLHVVKQSRVSLSSAEPCHASLQATPPPGVDGRRSVQPAHSAAVPKRVCNRRNPRAGSGRRSSTHAKCSGKHTQKPVYVPWHEAKCNFQALCLCLHEHGITVGNRESVGSTGRSVAHRVNFESPAEPRYLEGGAVNRVSSLPQGTANTQTRTDKNHVDTSAFTEFWRLSGPFSKSTALRPSQLPKVGCLLR